MNITIKQIHKYLSVKFSFWFLLLLSNSAFAQSSDEITQYVYNLCSYLSGNVARAAGVLALIILGYKCFRGTFDGHYLFFIMVGLGLIIGGAYYGKTVILGGM